MQTAVLNADRPGCSPAPVCSSFNYRKDSWTFFLFGLEATMEANSLLYCPFGRKSSFSLTNYPSYFLWTFLFLYLFASVEVSWLHLA